MDRLGRPVSTEVADAVVIGAGPNGLVAANAWPMPAGMSCW